MPDLANAATSPTTTGLAFGLLMLASCLVSTLCLLQRARDNALPVVDLGDYPPAAADRFLFDLDRCELTSKKIIVQGWLARSGQTRQARRARVVVRQAGQWRALSTRLRQVDAASEQAASAAGAGGFYRHIGFAASADLSRVPLAGTIDAVAVAHEGDGGRALLQLPCTLKAS